MCPLNWAEVVRDHEFFSSSHSIFYDITGYQRDFLKLRADHATSLHCDMIYYYNVTNIAVMKYIKYLDQ